MLTEQYQETVSSMERKLQSLKHVLEIMTPSLTSFAFLGFAFIMAAVIIVSIIPLYIENTSVPKTAFVLTTVRLNDYILQTNPMLAKRTLMKFNLSAQVKDILTYDEALSEMNSSIRYALEQQLKAGDTYDNFNISILRIIPYIDNLSNMSVILDMLIVYTRECIPCSKRRQSIIFRQLCSNNKLSAPIRFRLTSTQYSEPTTVYASFIPIKNISIITRIVTSSQFISVINNVIINESSQLTNRLLATSYTLTVTTTKSNYFATLDQTETRTPAKQNDGPVPLIGAIERQMQSSNRSYALTVTINQIILQLWYANNTIQVVADFVINFSIGCDLTCLNQRSNLLTNQLETLTNTQINIQPANLSDGQVKIFKGGNYVLFDYSLTTQVIANFTGSIVYAIPPTFTIIH